MAVAASGNTIIIPPSTALSSRQAHQFQQMRVDNELIDFVIHTNGREFKCHRVILAASSEYFRAMLRSGMKEAASNQANLDVISPAIVELLIDHMYQNEITVPTELLKETIEACHYLELLEMKEPCATQAAKVVVDPSNVIRWGQMAEKFRLENLNRKCTEIFHTSLAEVSKHQEFLQLSLGEVSSYLDATKMTTSLTDPDDHLEATLDWIQHDADDRASDMHNLLEKIHFLECSIECLETEIKTRAELFHRCPDAMALITQSLQQLHEQGGARKKRNKKGSKASMTVILGGYDVVRRVLNKSCWTLTKTMRLEKLCEIPDGHGRGLGVCKIPGGFAVTGSDDSVKCFMFLTYTKSWIPLASLQNVRYGHGSLFFQERIFLLGGSSNRQTQLSSVISLDPNNGESAWRVEREMPFPAMFPEVASAEVNNRLTLFLLNMQTKELISLDMETNEWSRKTAIPVQCSGARMIAVNGNTLLVTGGTNRCFARYSPENDTWVTGKAPNLEHPFGALVSYGQQRVYLLGGYSEDRVEEYSLDSESWSVCEWRVPSKLRYLHALELDM